MCGRFTRNYTWQQTHVLYRLTAPAAIPNLQPRFNACPTDPADTIVEHDGKRELVEMRWGLYPNYVPLIRQIVIPGVEVRWGEQIGLLRTIQELDRRRAKRVGVIGPLSAQSG